MPKQQMSQMEASMKTAALLAGPKPKNQDDAIQKVIAIIDANSIALTQDLNFMTERLEERGLVDGLLMFQETKERAALDKLDPKSPEYLNHPLTQKRYHWSTMWTELIPGMDPHPDAGKTLTVNGVIAKGLWAALSGKSTDDKGYQGLIQTGAPQTNGPPKPYGAPTMVAVNPAMMQANGLTYVPVNSAAATGMTQGNPAYGAPTMVPVQQMQQSGYSNANQQQGQKAQYYA